MKHHLKHFGSDRSEEWGKFAGRKHKFGHGGQGHHGHGGPGHHGHKGHGFGWKKHWWSAAFQEALTTYDKNDVLTNLDVQHFKPREISVNITEDNNVLVEAKYEEKEDEHGQISRHFVRRYPLPENCDKDRVESRLSSDGVLTIIAPKVDEEQRGRKRVPIIMTGRPAAQPEGRKELESDDNQQPGPRTETETEDDEMIILN